MTVNRRYGAFRQIRRSIALLEFSHATVERMLGRHHYTHITVTEHSSSAPHKSGGHSSSQTSVNSQKGYSVVFEADGKTFKFTGSDRIILKPGDRIL